MSIIQTKCRIILPVLSTLLLYIILLIPQDVASQDIEEFREFEDSLVKLSLIIYQGKKESEKYEANEIFLTLFEDALSLNNSFRYPFDSLRLIKILVAPDKKFRIITWMIAKDDGTYDYFGFIQSFSRRKNDFEVYPLTDMSESIESPETKVLDHKNWFGAVYYDVILTRSGSSRYYTLLGWDGNNPLVRRKLIEVLTIRSNGMPRFGQSLFRYGKPQIKRVFFEYSSLASMNLIYEKQHYYVKKKRIFYNHRKQAHQKSRKKPSIVNQRRDRGPYRSVRKGGHMIVFDNLVPLDPSLEGQKQFYVPEGNIVNGFHFSAGRWRFVEDIDARNPQHQYDNPKRRPVPEKPDDRNR